MAQIDTVRKDELVGRVARRAGVSQEWARGIMDALQDEMEDLLIDGFAVHVKNWGTFLPSWRGGKIFHNPKTGETIRTKGKTALRFKASAVLVKKLNGQEGRAE